VSARGEGKGGGRKKKAGEERKEKKFVKRGKKREKLE